MGTLLRLKRRRKMSDIIRLFSTAEDEDIVNHLRDVANQDRDLLSTRFPIETSCWLCQCWEEYEMCKMMRWALFAENVSGIANAIMLGRCPHIHGKSDKGGPRVLFDLIHFATFMNTKQTVEFLLSLDQRMVNWRTKKSNRTPLNIALDNNDGELAFRLLQLGADINIPTAGKGCDVNAESYFYHPLKVAKDLEMVKCMIQAGGDPNSGLTNAVCRGNCEMLSYLIDAGAKVDGHTDRLVAKAVSSGDAEMCRVLLEAGGNANEFNPVNRYTALRMAASSRNTEIVQLLLRYGADPNHKDTVGNTALHHAIGYHKPEVYDIPRVFDIPLLYDDWILLHSERYGFCGLNNILHTVKALVAAGADPNAENSHHATPLWNAVCMHRVDVVKFLVQLNVNLSVESSASTQPFHQVFIFAPPEFKSPLRVALDEGFTETTEVLLAGGYNIWREEWLELFTYLGRFSGRVPWRMVRRLSTLYSSPPSLLHLSKMFFRETFKLRLGVVVKDLPIPDRVKDFLTLEGLYSLTE